MPLFAFTAVLISYALGRRPRRFVGRRGLSCIDHTVHANLYLVYLGWGETIKLIISVLTVLKMIALVRVLFAVSVVAG